MAMTTTERKRAEKSASAPKEAPETKAPEVLELQISTDLLCPAYKPEDSQSEPRNVWVGLVDLPADAQDVNGGSIPAGTVGVIVFPITGAGRAAYLTERGKLSLASTHGFASMAGCGEPAIGINLNVVSSDPGHVSAARSAGIPQRTKAESDKPKATSKPTASGTAIKF